METEEGLMGVEVIGGDRRIAEILSQDGAVVYPAYACAYDGFVNDVFSEYANPSIVRPRSVREARLRSELTVRFHTDQGRYYLGWTMYDRAGTEESLMVWFGARKVAYVRSEDDDNRVHLYVLREPFDLQGEEFLRLVTDPTAGLYRFESFCLLPTLPQGHARQIIASDISAEIDQDPATGRAVVRLNWRTSRPARCRVQWAQPGAGGGEVAEKELLANHSVVLPGLGHTSNATFSIRGSDGRQGEFSTDDLALRAFLPAPASGARPGRVPFSMVNESGQAASAWPVTWGFPFPRGHLAELFQCRLVMEDGRVVPAQKRVQVRWDDGSVRWALLDFQVDLPASGEVRMALEYGPSILDEGPAEGLQATETGDGIVLDTGPLRLTLSRSRYVFPAVLEVRDGAGFKRVTGGNALAGIVLVDAEGKSWTSEGGVEALTLEEMGPLRCVVRMGTKHRSQEGNTLFRSVVRLTAYRGKDFLRVQHTFENDRDSQLFTTMRSISLQMGLDADWSTWARHQEETVPLNAGPLRLLQPLEDHYSVDQDGRQVARGKHAEGRLDVGGQAGSLTVVMRDFWQNYPKGWLATQGGVTLDICPDVSALAYPSDVLEDVRQYFYLRDGGYKLKRGMARTHDLMLVLSSDGAQHDVEACLFTQPPLVRVSSALLEQTGVLSALAGRQAPEAQGYNHWVDNALQLYEQDRVETHAYGLLNYGDWWGERRYNWGDMEYDTPYGFILEYLRGGSSRWFTLGWQAAWHLVDVDTCHDHPDPAKAGRQYLHALGHVGDYYPAGYLPGDIAGEHMSWSHTWVEGLFLYALLTGERRLWDVAMRTVQVLAQGDLNDYDFTNCRDSGWPLRHLIGAYQATGRKQFLNGARIIAERVLERQRPTGGWERMLVPEHCLHYPPRHMGNAGFMVGVLLAALKRCHEETGEQALAEAIVAGARYVIRSMWVPEESAFRYTSCPGSPLLPQLNAQIIEGIGYAWRLSGDEELRQVLLRGLEVALATSEISPPTGKDISTLMRSLPFILHEATKAAQGAH